MGYMRTRSDYMHHEYAHDTLICTSQWSDHEYGSAADTREQTSISWQKGKKGKGMVFDIAPLNDAQ